jgi:hypothetical protein
LYYDEEEWHYYVKYPYSSKLSTTDMSSASALLRGDPRLLKLPPYLSFLCILVGIAWLMLIPLNAYSRNTYVSENALLPGQVHTYFSGSDQNVFRAFKREVDMLAEKKNKELVNHSPLRFLPTNNSIG